MATNHKILTYQPGFQERFLSTDADICIGGGSAGVGKTFAVLLSILAHKDDPFFRAVVFRENSTQIRTPGGLWDESRKLFTQFGAQFRDKTLECIFPSGAVVKYCYMERDEHAHDHQGGQYTAIYWDEVTHMSEYQFRYLMSRNRSDSHVKGYIRGTCNPDVDSWVRRWVDWFIDPETGVAIPSRCGKLRWFIEQNGEMIWASDPQELINTYGDPELPLNHPDQVMPQSFTYIQGSIYENTELLKKRPEYVARLKGLDRVQRERLLYGNWNAKAEAGTYFKREWVEMIPHPPINVKWVRGYDKAATAPSETNRDPDYTAHVKMGITPNGDIIIADNGRYRVNAGEVYERTKSQAVRDGKHVRIVLPQDPGAAGKMEAKLHAKDLAAFDVRIRPITKNKVTNFLPFAAAAENGNVKVVKGMWNEVYFNELENFDGEGKGKDDQVDATSIAYNELVGHSVRLPDTISIRKVKQENRWKSIDG